jgi:lipoprotein-anchoring transpeptidase ErfK/SrfK
MLTRALPLPLLLTLALVALLLLASTAAAQDPATVPAPAPTGLAPAGSTVAGVDVSGQDAATALATVTAAYGQPIVIRVDDRVFKIWNAQIAFTADVQTAVTEAVNRTAAGNTPVTTEYNETKLQAAVDRIMRLSSTKGSPARWQLGRTKPLLKLGRPGNAPDRAAIVEQVKRAAALPTYRAQQDPIPLVAVNTSATLEQLGYVIVISKPSRVLNLYAPRKGKAKIVQQFKIAVGAPAYPTPTGTFTIVTMQKNPWWYPPASDWAKDAEPVPPGPSNPLGTRWMGLDREDVGIHGTPDSGSLGGFASHGCIRMYIPSAEKLYSLVDVGTPVIIY